MRDDLRAGVVICDDELSPAQQRTLEDRLKCKIIDRTALILDIFAQRARTREGTVQVALAQHEYLLPRLAGQWSHLERMEGAIGSRGPGETQLETDRRLIRNQIKRLKKELEQVRTHRRQQRRRRDRAGIPLVALVGYTNAGKSTLMNALTNAEVRARNRLFETLDPTTRRCRLDERHTVLLSDTVGFIQKLPTQLVAAFRATLEELQEADLLLHVVDATHPDAAQQAAAVYQTLADLGVDTRPTIVVLNKIDLLEEGEIPQVDGIPVSAETGQNLEGLRAAIVNEIPTLPGHPAGNGRPLASQVRPLHNPLGLPTIPSFPPWRYRRPLLHTALGLPPPPSFPPSLPVIPAPERGIGPEPPSDAALHHIPVPPTPCYRRSSTTEQRPYQCPPSFASPQRHTRTTPNKPEQTRPCKTIPTR